MAQIRPISDLRNKFADISKVVQETSEPVFLTKNGYGNMVVMSYDTYERLQYDNEIYFKLKEAEIEAAKSIKRISHKDVFSKLRQNIQKEIDISNV